MGPWRDLAGDFLEVPLHGPGVAARQHQGGAGAACRADGAEDVDRLGALVVRRAGPGDAVSPAPGDLVLLADQVVLGLRTQGERAVRWQVVR